MNRMSFFLALWLLPVGTVFAVDPTPNVILILVDDMGWMDSSTCFEINDWTIPPCKLILKGDT